MNLEPKIIVGAGLAGLTAAINIARSGRNVVVYEKESGIGGRGEIRPDPAGSPFDIGRLSGFIGIDISPAISRIDNVDIYAWGKKHTLLPRPKIPLYMVERGPRPTSLDSYLYKMALDSGVEFEFNHTIKSREEIDDLPKGSIIATGLELGGFEGAEVPYLPLYGYCGRGTCDKIGPMVNIYIDDFTRDYAFSCSINKISFAMLFQKGRPLMHEGIAKFQEMIEKTSGLNIRGWEEVKFGACPHRAINNPRFTLGDKILAGTLAGAMEPAMYFGMLGAMISGKIASLAVSDPGRARRQFFYLNITFPALFLLKKLFDISPELIRKGMVLPFIHLYPIMPDFLIRLLFMILIPGYRRFG